MTHRDLQHYAGLDNRDLKARSVLDWYEQRMKELKRFIQLWETATSTDYICHTLDVQLHDIYWLAARLKKQGVRLREFPMSHAPNRKPHPRGVKLDYDALEAFRQDLHK